MKRPKTSESKYWENDRFRHLLFIEDLEDYTTSLEEQIAKNCVIPAVSKSVTCHHPLPYRKSTGQYTPGYTCTLCGKFIDR